MKRYRRIHKGVSFITVGLALVALGALIDALFMGPNILYAPMEISKRVSELYVVFAYLPGTLSVAIGVAVFFPAVSRLTEEIDRSDQITRRLKSQAEDLQAAKRRAEAAEDVLFEALESISEAFIIFDEEDRVVAFNSRYRDLFEDVGDALQPGVTFEELIRHQAAVQNSFDDPAELEEWIEKRLNEHRNPVGSREQVFGNGDVYRLTEVKTPSGGTVAVRTNITDLRTREKALRVINERLQEAQLVAHIGHWSYDIKNDRHDWSDEISRIMGYDPDTLEVKTSAYLARVHPEDLEHMRSVVRQAQQSEQDYELDYRMVRPNGEIVHVREIGRVQKDENGETEFYRGTIQDISAQYEAQMELLDAKMKAEEGTKAKSLFLANMSHELRTPLNAIIGFAEVITKEIFGPINNDKYREYSGNILASGQHLLSLINDILDFSRLEAGKYELEEEDVDVQSVVKWTELLLASKALEKDIRLTYDVPDDLIFIGDERKFKQVLINLTNNAIKFTPNSGEIHIFTETRHPAYFSLFVRDNGIGIEEHELEMVMKPFVRTLNSQTRSIEGTGLGLPLSKSIIELHGGELLIESQIDHGTCVEIRIPKTLCKKLAKSA
ncbi:ATP-binding protein [Sneathiella glossodoripedis]|uniref:ATP-binding protein n=1 Tax=Sneathiella glossodoripedis TaxID=418853 RepID=UPI00131F4444|nr:ATP-binding protein [Sneathiella glossodoripedis]